MKKWKVLIAICFILLILFFIQFAIVAPNMDWSLHLIREIEYPIPYFGMLGSIIGIGLSVIGANYEQNKKGRK